jgi:hypothetical protein
VAVDPPDSFSSELDRIEQILAHKDAELQRLRTELALKTLYIDELQATLESQARELEAFDLRLRRMEMSAQRQSPSPPAPEQPLPPRKPVPLLIRIRKGMRE